MPGESESGGRPPEQIKSQATLREKAFQIVDRAKSMKNVWERFRNRSNKDPHSTLVGLANLDIAKNGDSIVQRVAANDKGDKYNSYVKKYTERQTGEQQIKVSEVKEEVQEQEKSISSSLETEFQKTDQEEYETGEIKSLEGPMLSLMQELESAVDEGRYDLIIGDDTSARLPSLIAKKVIDYQNEKIGRKKIPLFFVQASSRYISDIDVSMQIKELTKHYDIPKDKKVLILTEYIRSGDSLKRLAEQLTAVGINYDVAAMAAKFDEASYRRNGIMGNDTQLFLSHKLDYEGKSKGLALADLPVYRKPDLAGIGQNESESITRSHVLQTDAPTTVTGISIFGENRERTKAARKDVNKVATSIIQRLSQRNFVNNGEYKKAA